jgi:hypothetical protein
VEQGTRVRVDCGADFEEAPIHHESGEDGRRVFAGSQSSQIHPMGTCNVKLRNTVIIFYCRFWIQREHWEFIGWGGEKGIWT